MSVRESESDWAYSEMETLDAILLKMILLQIWRCAMMNCFMQEPGYRKTQYR